MLPKPKQTSSHIFVRALEEYLAHLPPEATPHLEGPGTSSLAAWFLGPKAENQELFSQLVVQAIREHCAYRNTYYPEDPIYVTASVKESEEYRASVEKLEEHFGQLLEQLKGSLPFYSYRFQGHMNWDTTLPGMLGFFAAMLYNQNNVAAEASPVTTPLEMQVGNDLCRMLGYRVPSKQEVEAGAIQPWGHITCDGSVANLEAMWASRNLKYYPLSLAEALKSEPELSAARDITIPLLNGEQAVLADLDTWTLLNLKADDILAIPTRIDKEYGIPPDTLTKVLDNYTLQSLGFEEFSRKLLRDGVQTPVIMATSTMHYSWPKAAAVLGLGANNIEKIHINLDARMEIQHLRRMLDACLSNKRPVIMTVVILGSTEESAIDPLADVIALREEYRQAGLEFTVHVDAAWGGYFASILREDPHASFEELREQRQSTPELVMSAYVTRQYEALEHADSITVDPHKAGFIPYPAGGLCYRNMAMRNLVSFTAPVVYHGGIDPTVGVYGIEGSKPGAAAAAVYLSHRIIRTNRSGYGKILGKCLFNSKRLYTALVTMAKGDDPFIVVPFQQLPAQRAGESPDKVQAQLEFIRTNIVPKTNDELFADPEAMSLFRELGSDQVIIAYTFNFKTEEGLLNEDITLLNNLNQAIFESLSLSPDRDRVLQTPMLVTSSEFEPDVYGQDFVDAYKQRLGVEGDPNVSVKFLISTTMDPWLTDTAEGNFIPTIIQVLRETVINAIAQIRPAPN